MITRITLITSLVYLASCTVPGQSYYNYPIPSYNTYYPPSYQNFRYAPSPPQQQRHYDNDSYYSPAAPYQTRPRNNQNNYYHYRDNDAGYYYDYPPRGRQYRNPNLGTDGYDVAR